MKHFFFDDEKLLVRENVRRTLGKAELIADSVYHDEACETIFCTGSAFFLEGKYRCLFFGMCKDGVKRAFVLESRDGIHFEPEDVSARVKIKQIAPHHILDLPAAEIADVYEDKTAEPSQRYKLLMADCKPDCVNDNVYVSPDLIEWTLLPGASWGRGTEPLAGVFYNGKKQCHTILHRPFWGIRKVGYSETKDFFTLSEYRPCLHQDALDEPLAEIYGMKAFSYEGMFIGLAQIYGGLKNELNSKFKGGTETAQLTYSADGRYWLRSLREPFISGAKDKEKLGYENKMVWPSQMRRAENGDVLILASATEEEHGHFVPGTRGTLQTYRVRADGFICLETENAAEASRVATREKLWHGGEAHINLTAKKATAAVYETREEDVKNPNMLSFTHPVEGMGHADCVPFSGDSVDWTPVFSSGRTLDEMAGRTLVLEVRFTDGRLYSIGGDFTELFNVDACFFRRSGTLPEEER